MKEKILSFIKKEIVFEVSLLLALASIISLLVLKIKPEIYKAIDFRVLAILLSLMLVVSGFQEIGLFSWCAKRLCSRLKSLRLICLTLILLCFFSSMLITNDVSLITFVPFALMILWESENFDRAILLVVLQTIAANLGSMLTPIGNPQNLFLFSKMEISLGHFMLILLPYTLFSLLLLICCTFLFPRKKIQLTRLNQYKIIPIPRKKFISGLILFPLLFVLCILCVLNILPFYIVLPLVFLATGIFKYKLLLKADYMLLLTFSCFFIFTHNIAKIEIINSFLQNIVSSNELWVSLLLSQFISNVPASLLLYPFSSNLKNLLIGVNLGGLGSLVASLASLISFKIYSSFSKENKSSLRYLGIFTLFNLAFLLLLILLHSINFPW
ncbi:MAG: citrate transporter [Treponemataceae bacterium]|nr:citrate transporter [Treponemataceae bacterium]